MKAALPKSMSVQLHNFEPEEPGHGQGFKEETLAPTSQQKKIFFSVPVFPHHVMNSEAFISTLVLQFSNNFLL